MIVTKITLFITMWTNENKLVVTFTISIIKMRFEGWYEIHYYQAKGFNSFGILVYENWIHVLLIAYSSFQKEAVVQLPNMNCLCALIAITLM